MSATPANTDSNLSGKPSNDIDKQKGPATGSNVESPGSSLGPITKPVQGGNNPSDQGSSGNNNQQQQTGSGSK